MYCNVPFSNRNWSRRSQRNQNTLYKMKVFRNNLDARFDPVSFLLLWFSVSGITSGPIFQTRATSVSMMQHIDSDDVCRYSGSAFSQSSWSDLVTTFFIEVHIVSTNRFDIMVVYNYVNWLYRQGFTLVCHPK
jgi:hypothetical protein